MVIVKLKKIYMQPDDYSCGPTSLKTLMEHTGTEVSLDGVRKAARTTENGTLLENLKRAAKTFGFEVKIKEKSTLENLRRSLELGNIPLVRYLKPEDNDPHYSLFCGIYGSNVLIADSETGKIKVYRKEEFTNGWHSIDGPGCMMTIRKKA